MSGCGKWAAGKRVGCAAMDNPFLGSLCLTARASAILYSRLLTDHSGHLTMKPCVVPSWESHQCLVTAWQRRPDLHGSHKCQTGSVRGAALTVADPVTVNSLLKGEGTILFSCRTVFWGKGAQVAKTEGIVGQFFSPYHPGFGVLPVAFA